MKKRPVILVFLLAMIFRFSTSCLETPQFFSAENLFNFRKIKVKQFCTEGVNREEDPQSVNSKSKKEADKKDQKFILSPHAELVLGMVLGFND